MRPALRTSTLSAHLRSAYAVFLGVGCLVCACGVSDGSPTAANRPEPNAEHGGTAPGGADGSASPVLPAQADGGVSAPGRSDAGAPDPEAQVPTCGRLNAEVRLGVPYRSVAGVDPNLLSLDLYLPERSSCARIPLVVWVHGGGWAVGDKSNKLTDKRRLFASLGYAFASINYRLSISAWVGTPREVRHPTHVQDVAAALDFLLDGASAAGVDSQRLAVLGHSAGAHLAALVSTAGDFLLAHGRTTADVRCTGAYDTEGYDVSRVMAAGPSALYENAFGSDPAVWDAASPMTYVERASTLPAFQLARRGSSERRDTCDAFSRALSSAGASVRVIEAGTLTHEEVNDSIGAPGDLVMTPFVKEFLAACFRG